MEELELSGIDGSFLAVGQEVQLQTSTPCKSQTKDTEQNLEGTPSCKEDNIYNCPKCTYSTSRAYNYRRHKRTHVEERKFQCQKCTKSFVDRYYLDMHMKSSHENMMFLCDDCGDKYACLKSLQKHKKKHHKKELKYQCSECGKKFMEKLHFQGHFNSHHKIKTEKCRKCGSKFTYRSSLNKHLLTCGLKTGKAYECAVCKQVFTRKAALLDHVNGMHADPSIVCPDCGKRFKWRSSLAYHVKRHHTTGS